MLANEIELHRLVWSPDDFDGEALLTSAFRRQDLSGGESDFVSVSRVDKINPDAEMEILESQASKADGERIFREEAWSVTFNVTTQIPPYPFKETNRRGSVS